MNIARIMVKEFKQNIRNYKANLMMILLPIVLITILGAAFSNVFENTVDMSDVHVLYTQDVDKTKPYLTNAFQSFREQMTKELGIIFDQAADVDAGIQSIENFAYCAYIYVSDDQQEIKLYKNARHSFYAGLVESALNSFTDTYSAISVISAFAPSAESNLQGTEQSYVTIRSLDKKRGPGSLDYYAITMITLVLLYSSITGYYSIRDDIEQMTANRILSAPVRRYELLTGKVLGSILVTVVQGFVVILFSKLILKAYWGEDLVTVALLIFSYSIMAVSIGVGIAYLFRKGDAGNGILNATIPMLVFLGGGYVPLSVIGPTFSRISNISPVTWINSALFELIYDGSYTRVPISIGLDLIIAAAFILLTAILSRKGTEKYA
jgi:ABC-2 type transport system permease protein